MIFETTKSVNQHSSTQWFLESRMSTQ